MSLKHMPSKKIYTRNSTENRAINTDISALSSEFLKLPEIIKSIVPNVSNRSNNMNSSLSSPLSESKKVTDNIIKMMNTLNTGTDSFTGKLLTGFSQTLGIVNSISAILKSINDVSSGLGLFGNLFNGIFGGLLGFIPGAGPALSAVAHAALRGGQAGGMTPVSGGLPSVSDIRGNVNSYSGSGSNNPIVNHIHISGTMDGQTFLMKNYPQYNNTQNIITGS